MLSPSTRRLAPARLRPADRMGSLRSARLYSQIKTDWAALSFARCARLEGPPNARRSRRGTRGPAEWQLPARCAFQENDRALETH